MEKVKSTVPSLIRSSIIGSSVVGLVKLFPDNWLQLLIGAVAAAALRAVIALLTEWVASK